MRKTNLKSGRAPRQRRGSRAVCLTSVVALLVAACASGEEAASPVGNGVQAEQEETTITMWHWETPPQRVVVHDAMAERFHDETGIRLEHIAINFPDYQQRMLSAIQAGQLPDMIQVNPPTFMTLYQSNAAVPVTDLFQDLNSEHGFFDGGNLEIDGENWGIPAFGVIWPLVYRADIYDQLGMPRGPETWDELLDAAERFQSLPEAEDMHAFGLPVSTNGNYGSQNVWGFLASNGAAIVDCTAGPEEIVFDSPETIETYEFLAELAKYSPPGKENWAWAEGELALKSGLLATAVFTGSWINAARQDDPELVTKYRYAPMPVRESGMKSRNTGYVRNIAVTTGAEERGNMEAVETWLRWLTKPENHAEYLQMEPGLFMPVSEGSANAENWTQSQVVQDYPELIAGQVEAAGRVATIGFSNDCASLNAGRFEGSHVISAVLQRIVFDGEPVADAVRWGHEQFVELQVG